jgi:hypothetical protein
LVKRGSKQFRRSLKTWDRLLAEHRLRSRRRGRPHPWQPGQPNQPRRIPQAQIAVPRCEQFQQISIAIRTSDDQ